MHDSPGISRRAALTGLSALGLAACSSSGKSATSGSSSTPKASTGSGSSSSSTTTTTPPVELPGGGRTIFPSRRLVGYCGLPGAAALGQLGIGDLSTAMQGMLAKVKQYDDGVRKPLPTMELIAVVVEPRPGRDGKWRTRIDDTTIATWSEAAQQHDAILLLNIQPGRAEFIDEAKALEKWLVKPHIGLALDPEWAMAPGQVPMRVFGHTTGAKIDEVAVYLASLVKQHNLPEKPLVIHVLKDSILVQPEGLKEHAGVAIVKSVDGIGVPQNKIKAYERGTSGIPSYVHPGFKLFFQEDVQAGGPLMTPKDVLALKPQPDYVMYE